ncbi:MAG: MBL fold metallo-hydrolase [Herpetosiphonaceae bacterium]|nr:MAG: MBL fold metallo-hydrolase [Herpetosiphonaceae bacterium]
MANLASVTIPESVRLVDDLHLGQPHVIGTYLLPGDQPALVDPGPSSTLPNLEQGLAAQGFSLDQVQAIVLTHIHLDHAGATGTLVARYPHLRVYVHQRGAPHLVAPERLIASATRLYGDAMDQLWGEILPVPQEQVVALEGGEVVRLGERRLRVSYAPGHASHHVIFFDEAEGLAFVGDVTGVRLPGSFYARPPTPPPDIDLEAWSRSLDLLRDLGPRALLLTHFGPVYDVAEHIESFRARLMRWGETVREGLESGENEAAQIERLRRLAESELGETAGEEQALYQQATPIEQSWLGLVRYWRKRLER